MAEPFGASQCVDLVRKMRQMIDLLGMYAVNQVQLLVAQLAAYHIRFPNMSK